MSKSYESVGIRWRVHNARRSFTSVEWSCWRGMSALPMLSEAGVALEHAGQADKGLLNINKASPETAA